MTFLVVDNFFDNFQNIQEHFKKIPLYNHTKYHKKLGKEQGSKWPGKRSLPLNTEQPFLFNLIMNEMFVKFHNCFENGRKIKMAASVNLRLNKDDKKDFVHTDDPYLFTLMIYLSETNLKSGTGLFDTITSKKPNTIVDFVQNRAFLFNSKIPHKSLHNYGSNINNGRLTLNCFIKYINEK